MFLESTRVVAISKRFRSKHPLLALSQFHSLVPAKYKVCRKASLVNTRLSNFFYA
jgi:hypothetical protein